MVTEQQGPRRSRSVVPRLLALIAIVALVLVGLNWASWALRSSDRTTHPIADGFDRVDVDVDAGSVRIEGSDDGTASLTATTESALLADADVSFDVEDGQLTVEGDCSSGLWLVNWGRCSVEVVLRVPPDVAVVANSGAGTVTTVGLTGSADLSSSAGAVRVDGHSGPLRAHSSAGGVTVTGLSSDDAEITSSAGAVDVTAIDPPASLRASSSAGRVTVALPDGQSYNVDADSSAGSTTVEVPTDSSSPYRVEAKSSAGAVTVRAN
ncbi:MAG TPA: DUF4097 family beta strand repeat-containing protein [Jiangellales bacterium]|nr:DUF4097 family beta strand repeat-containing protein [Jiangellales bacterium]